MSVPNEKPKLDSEIKVENVKISSSGTLKEDMSRQSLGSNVNGRPSDVNGDSKHLSTQSIENSVDINKTPTAQTLLAPPNHILRYQKPYGILITPIPFISTILPFLGHFSICSAKGNIHDFFSSKYVSINQLNYGKPSKYIILEVSEEEKKRWDSSLKQTDKKFRKKMYSFCGNNSYKYCASMLSTLEYNKKKTYSKWDIIKLGIRKGKYFSKCDILKSYVGFCVIMLCVIIVILVFCIS